MIQPQTYSLSTGERHILSLKVKCDNGCNWIGELCSLEEHLINCDLSLLPCPNECKKGKKILELLRKDIAVHKEVCPRRQYKCSLCQEAGEYKERTTTHLKECPKVKISCPNNGCNKHIQRCNMPQHRQKCMFEPVPCKYAKISCEINVPRKDLDEHQNDTQKHLQLAIDTVCRQEMTIKRQEEEITQLKSMPIKFKITSFSKLKACNEIVYSPAFYTSPGGYKMCIRVDTNGGGVGKGTHVSVYAYLMRGENDDNLPWPFTGTVTVELLNQLEDDNHYSDKTTFPPDEVSQRVENKERASNGYGSTRYISHSDLGYNAKKRCQYLKNDCLYFKVTVDANSIKPWLV